MSYASTILAETNLVNYWRLNDVSGTSAADSKGATALTYSGGFTLNQTALIHEGASVLLNGTTGKVSQAAVLTTARTNVTFECWFKLSSTTVNSVIFSNGNNLNTYGLRANSSGSNRTLQYNHGGTNVDTGQILNTTTANHVALVLDGSSVAYVYLNGNLVLTHTTAPSTPGNSFFGIGSDNSTCFSGYIQEFAYYNAALSQSTILAHYNAASTTEKARITQVGSLILGTPDPPKARISQVGAIVLSTGDAKARISEHGLLSIVKGTPAVRIGQTGILTIVKLGAAPVTSGGASLLPSL